MLKFKNLFLKTVLSLGVFALIGAGIAFAAINDYTVTGGNPASLPNVGATASALGLITITDAGGDDFADPENIVVAINTVAYPSVEFDQDVVAGDLTIAGSCEYNGSNAL